MTEKELNINNVKSYWIDEAEEALTVAEHLYEKADYSKEMYQGIYPLTNASHQGDI